MRDGRSDKLDQASAESVQDFYKQHATTLPDKKTVSLKTREQKSILTMTTKRLHRMYTDESNVRISLSLFRKLRPKKVMTVDNNKFRTGLCEVCLNMAYKATALRFVGVDVGDKHDLVAATLCPIAENCLTYQPECIQRKCEQCGVHKLSEKATNLDLEASVTWKKWMKDPASNRRCQTSKETSLGVLIKETEQALETFPEHIHVAQWQQKQYHELRRKLNSEERMVVSVQDFAENYRHLSQDEVSSAYFAYVQSTLLTSVSSYVCPTCETEVIDESCVFLSSDLKHDSFIVKEATSLLEDHLKKTIKMEKHVIFSDGCGCQFKAKGPFLNLLNETTERHYFGSQHGKSACDSLGGIVKKGATRYVSAGRGVITTTEDFFHFCVAEMATTADCKNGNHKARSFFFLNPLENHTYPVGLKAVRNTRKVHSVRHVDQGVIQTRHLSCFCDACRFNEKEKQCLNEKYTGDWVRHELLQKDEEHRPKKKARGKRRKEDEEENEIQPQPKRRSRRLEKVPNPKVNIYFYSSKSASHRYKYSLECGKKSISTSYDYYVSCVLTSCQHFSLVYYTEM